MAQVIRVEPLKSVFQQELHLADRIGRFILCCMAAVFLKQSFAVQYALYRSNQTSSHAQIMRIQRSGTCGNSPKNTMLEDLTVALASGDTAGITALTTVAVSWRRPGQPLADGQTAVLAAATRKPPSAASTLVIQHVVSHGRAGAVTASLTTPQQPASDFCLFFTFANAKGSAVDTITTYRAD